MKKNVSLNNASTKALQQLIKTGTALNYSPALIRKYKLPMVMSRAQVQQLFSGCLKEKGKKNRLHGLNLQRWPTQGRSTRD